MPTSNTPEDDSWKEQGDWADFDVKEFARSTIQAYQMAADDDDVMEQRVIRIEECVAARWPRRWLLWARLRREIRASVAGYSDDHIPRRDFLGRRLQAVSEMSTLAYLERQRRLDEGLAARDARLADEAAQAVDEGDADPGEGLLP